MKGREGREKKASGFHKQMLPSTFVNRQKSSEAENYLHHSPATWQKAGPAKKRGIGLEQCPVLSIILFAIFSTRNALLKMWETPKSAIVG